MEWILNMQAQCPPLLIGQSPPALLWCVMVWCTVHCWPVSHAAMLYVYCCSFLGRNQFLYLSCQLPTSQHVLADGGVDASLEEGDQHCDQGVECCVCKHWDLSTCHGSHIGCQNWAVMGLPPHSGWVDCALGTQQWTNNSTDWLDIR